MERYVSASKQTKQQFTVSIAFYRSNKTKVTVSQNKITCIYVKKHYSLGSIYQHNFQPYIQKSNQIKSNTTMRSFSKMSSEPNLYASRGSSSTTGNKSFGVIPAAAGRKPITSYKLSSKVRNILSKELGKSSSSTSTSALSLTRSISSNSSNSSNIYGYGNVTSDDSSLQSTNTARRRFQRRGSKAPSMFKQMSLGDLGLDETPEEEPSQLVQQQTLSMNDQMIPNDSCRSALTSLSLDESTFSSDCMEDSFNLGEFSG